MWMLVVGIALLWLLTGVFAMCVEFGSSLRDPIALRSREQLPDNYWYGALLGPIVFIDELKYMREHSTSFGVAWPNRERWILTRRNFLERETKE